MVHRIRENESLKPMVQSLACYIDGIELLADGVPNFSLSLSLYPKKGHQLRSAVYTPQKIPTASS